MAAAWGKTLPGPGRGNALLTRYANGEARLWAGDVLNVLSPEGKENIHALLSKTPNLKDPIDVPEDEPAPDKPK
jgi:hypothetical protein